ncbi:MULTISPECIES: hypothetical protein [Aquimarina]|uniref:hypothetical protein n=1 Tax=Aquimarina TaxID=290174 RepID=UPI00130499FD|nr:MULTISPECIES: hypothetical protein [Aquimarina]
MAITRQAKNYKIEVKDQYKCIVGKKIYKNANKIIIDALNGDMNLSSNKKVINNGGA